MNSCIKSVRRFTRFKTQAEAKGLFEAIESTLLARATRMVDGAGSTDGSQKLRQIIAEKQKVRFDADISDEALWKNIYEKIFYAWTRSRAVTERIPAIQYWLQDWESLAQSCWDVDARAQGDGCCAKAYLADQRVLRNRRKLKYIVSAARHLAYTHRRSSALIDCFVGCGERPHLRLSLDNIHSRFERIKGIGIATAYHIMTDLGLKVVKPDFVLVRTAIRIGIITGYMSDGGLIKLDPFLSADEARRLASNRRFVGTLQAIFHRLHVLSGYSFRRMDFSVVKLGQEPEPQNGVLRTICGRYPACWECALTPMCRRYEHGGSVPC